MKAKTRRAGFSLIEILVVIAIILILARLLMPSVARARQIGWSAACVSNLHQIGVAVILYTQDAGRGFPYINGDWLNPPVTTEGSPPSSWNVGFRRTVSWNTSRVNSVFWCPMHNFRNTKAVSSVGDNWWMGSYGINACIGIRVSAGGSNGGRNNLIPERIKYPSEVILAADDEHDHAVINEARRPSGYCPCSSFGVYGQRHLGRGNLVFVDGHADTMTEAQTLSPTDLWQTDPAIPCTP